MIITPDSKPKSVYLDGVETKDVCLINTREKYAEVFVRDENSNFKIDGECLQTKRIPFRQYKIEVIDG